MSCYALLPLCVNSKVPIGQSNKPDKPLKENEQLMLITDLAVAALAITAGVLIILQVNGVINLGALSGLGSIGSQAAYIMLGVGAGIIAIDLVKLAIQQARHINRLHLLITEGSARYANLETQTSNDTQARIETVQTLEERISELRELLSKVEFEQTQDAEKLEALNQKLKKVEAEKTKALQIAKGLRKNLQVQEGVTRREVPRMDALNVDTIQKQMREAQEDHERVISELKATQQQVLEDMQQQLDESTAIAKKVPTLEVLISTLKQKIIDLSKDRERIVAQSLLPPAAAG